MLQQRCCLHSVGSVECMLCFFPLLVPGGPAGRTLLLHILLYGYHKSVGSANIRRPGGGLSGTMSLFRCDDDGGGRVVVVLCCPTSSSRPPCPQTLLMRSTRAVRVGGGGSCGELAAGSAVGPGGIALLLARPVEGACRGRGRPGRQERSGQPQACIPGRQRPRGVATLDTPDCEPEQRDL